MKKLATLFAVTAIAALGLVACGSSDDSGDPTTAVENTPTTPTTGGGGGGGGETINVSAPADGSFAFDTSSLTAKSGEVTIDFNNPATLPHDVKVEDSNGKELGGTDLVDQGTASATLDLAPGTYTYFCDVPGHREGGMEGTLTVN
ncbi:MAG: hypothetical protein EXQ70_08145 [Solirubrobacterales bacterium]|nr:hypothetical protein [Solirubrobacterales bacterium]